MGLPSASPGNHSDVKRSDYLKSRNRGYQAAFRERCKPPAFCLRTPRKCCIIQFESARLPEDTLLSIGLFGFMPPEPTDNAQCQSLEYPRRNTRNMMQKDINALSSKIGDAREQITSGHSRLRALQDTNRRLLARLDTLDDSLGAIQSYSAATDVDKHDLVHSAGAVGPADSQLDPVQPSSMLCPQSHFPTAPNWNGDEGTCCENVFEEYVEIRPVRSIWKSSDQEHSHNITSGAVSSVQDPDGAAYAPSAVISYASVAACAPAESRASAATNSTTHDWFQPSLMAYVHGTASKLCARPQDVQWIAQLPYALPGGGFLSTACSWGTSQSSNDASTALSDALSQFAAQKACVVESLLLEAEHEHLEVSSAKVAKVATSASHTRSLKLLQDLRDEASQPPCPPNFCPEPNNSFLQQLYVRSGVHGACSLAVAVKHTVACMLRRHCTALPLRLWRAACMRAAEWLHACLRELQAKTPDAERCLTLHLDSLRAETKASANQKAPFKSLEGGKSDTVTRVHSGGATELPLHVVPAALVLMTQAMLFEVSSVISATSDQGEERNTHASNTEDIRARMLELQGSLAIMGRCQFLNSPRSAAQHFVEESVNPDNIIDAQGQIISSEILEGLQLSDEQHAMHVQLWHAWRQKSHALDKTLGNANSVLTSSLPQSEDLELCRLALMHASDAFDGIDRGSSDHIGEDSEGSGRKQACSPGVSDDQDSSAFGGAYSAVPAVSGVLCPGFGNVAGGNPTHGKAIAADFSKISSVMAQNAAVTTSGLQICTPYMHNAPMQGPNSGVSMHAMHAMHAAASAVNYEADMNNGYSKVQHIDDASAFPGSAASCMLLRRETSHSSHSSASTACMNCSDCACPACTCHDTWRPSPWFCSAKSVPEMAPNDRFEETSYLKSPDMWLEEAPQHQIQSQRLQSFDHVMGSFTEYSAMEDSGMFRLPECSSEHRRSTSTVVSCNLFSSSNTGYHKHSDNLDGTRSSVSGYRASEGLMGGYMGGSGVLPDPPNGHDVPPHPDPPRSAVASHACGPCVPAAAPVESASECRSRRLLGESGAQMHEVGHAFEQLLAYNRKALAAVVDSCLQLYSLTPVRFQPNG